MANFLQVPPKGRNTVVDIPIDKGDISVVEMCCFNEQHYYADVGTISFKAGWQWQNKTDYSGGATISFKGSTARVEHCCSNGGTISFKGGISPCYLFGVTTNK